MQIDFTGKTILVTGGSRGIGLATVLAAAEAGANVGFTFEKNKLAAQSAIAHLRAIGREALSFQMSNTDEEAITSSIEETERKFGCLDVLVINAGIWNRAPIDEMTVEEYDEMMDINMKSTFLFAKHAARVMKKRRSGSIVIVSSTAGQRGESEHSHYAASKGAQISFTKSLAPELAPFGIRVNSVAPGWVRTDMTRGALEEEKTAAWVNRQIPLVRVAEPTEMANAILFIASPLASFITGEILNVNGGAVLCG